MKISRRNLPLSHRGQWVTDFDGEPKISPYFTAGEDHASVTVDIRKQRLEMFFTKSEVARMLATFN